MVPQKEIIFIVSEMRALARPLTVAEAYAQVYERHPALSGAECRDAALRILGLIAAQEFAAARAKRRQS